MLQSRLPMVSDHIMLDITDRDIFSESQMGFLSFFSFSIKSKLLLGQ